MVDSTTSIAFIAGITLLLVSAQALDFQLKGVVCNNTLPITLQDNHLSMTCSDGKQACSLGSEVVFQGTLKYSGVDEIGLVDDYAFVSADMHFVSLQFDLLKYLQVPMCGDYVLAEENNENECPGDGLYEVDVPFVFPSEESDPSWMATGWDGSGRIEFFSEANNYNSLIGMCDIYVSTAVTSNDGDSLWVRLPVPSAKITTIVLLAFVGLLLVTCVFRSIRACSSKKKKQKILAADDGHSDSGTAFKKLEES